MHQSSDLQLRYTHPKAKTPTVLTMHKVSMGHKHTSMPGSHRTHGPPWRLCGGRRALSGAKNDSSLLV